MILREFIDKDTQNKNRLFAELQCDVCAKVVKKQVRQIKYQTCSQACTEVLKGNRLEVSCAHCGNRFYRAKNKVNASRSGLQFCDRKCKEAAQKYNPLIQPEHYGTGSDYRKIALEFYGARCEHCGFDSNIKALDVHHKDRNRCNNNIDNLQVLCCNCHAIEHRG